MMTVFNLHKIYISIFLFLIILFLSINSYSFADDVEEEEKEVVSISDPLYYFNFAMFQFNDKMFLWILKPVTKGYNYIMPHPVRFGIKNFFYNLSTPVRFVNCLLQGKGIAAEAEFASFIVNSTIGFLGVKNISKMHSKLKVKEEDLGQTLAVYGINNGFYIVLPFLGPSTFRDAIGMIGDYFINPLSYIESSALWAGIQSFKNINSVSFRIGDYESFKEASMVPYVSFRDAYIEYRNKNIKE